ncbi:hypothetical protein RISK_003645 [Rhodopirellula islandica]|uniref:Signal peptide and transmembrane protein n=1 Tax=Rhodopirellula islandica TaxID=595434 RepID=A0A0J1BDL3_RHOIS|nr:hypothetical protein [Rhodopirellula islandica]KLU04591.1 hypothetical protein RISK_003645 [Rhodopirellula islandica]
MNIRKLLALLLSPLFLVSSALGEEVEKPIGTYASVITRGAVQNKNMKGGLVRVTWSEIEPRPGQFNFTRIEEQIRLLQPNMNWTLAIHGGWTSTESRERTPSRANIARGRRRPLSLSPSWLVSDLHVETFSMSFRGNPVEMPKYWDPIVQERLKKMLQAVGNQYRTERLKLIYVPQMTSNGTEGHFNGVPSETLLRAAGINPRDRDAEKKFGDLWLQAATEATQSVLSAFPGKAVAFEVHELFRSTEIPERLISEFQEPEYEDRVGIGMWWISGKTTYQGNLISLLKNYQGDLYGQVIGRSDQPNRFENNDYTTVFQQAEELGMRYIEPWNYEFENRTFDKALQEFNASAHSKYATP